jgi:serine O-acetyltransferase
VNDSISGPDQAEARAREVSSRHPPFMKALLADAAIAAALRGERSQFRSSLDGVLQAMRLMLKTDAFFALAAYRAKASMQSRGVPVLPWIAHRLAMMSAQISIGDAVLVHPGVYIPNGQVVIYGVVEVHVGVTLLPWTTVSPIAGGIVGPTIGPLAQIGTGAKILGDIQIGAQARIGVNAVVLDDVPAKTTVVGIPARAVDE